uniref:C2H2-type domain-containing protein n=1 Tax=viral metagenome TaxID=1070528 RepID=A0A6C0EES1_9ZZZZ
MNENNEQQKLYHCNICIKDYASHSSLCNHNKKYHKINLKKCINTVPISNTIVTNCNADIIKCRKCEKVFNNRQTKWRHEKKCEKPKIDFDIIEKKLEEFKNTIFEMIQKEAKIHPKTLQKINKQLINNTTNNISNTNNGTIINNTYVKFGNEQLSSLLSKNDMLKIINKQCLCIEESIKSVHFNKNLPEYNNIFITNMKDTIAYIFDGSKFILTSKDEVINDLYNSHLENIEQFLEEAKIPENKYSKITKFLDTLNDNEKCFIDGASNNKKYNNYKAYKLVAIKNLIYNASDHKLLKKLNNIELKEKISDEIKLE